MRAVPKLLVCIAIIAVLTGYYAWRDRYQARRLDRLAALAPELGMRVVGRNLKIKNADLLQAPLFKEGKEPSRSVSFAMEGTATGVYGLIGDYQYDYDSDDSDGRSVTHTNSQTFAAYSSPDHKLPIFELEEKNTSNYFTITGNTKERVVAFDAQPEFAKRFYLMSDNIAETRRVFTADLRAVLLQVDAQRNWRVEASGPWVVFFRDDSYVKAEDFRQFVKDTSRTAAEIFEKCDCGTSVAGKS